MVQADFEPYHIFDFAKLSFTKEELKSIPKHHLIYICQSCLAANDIAVFVKLLIGHYRRESDDLLNQIAALNVAILQRTMLSKLFEYLHIVDCYRLRCKRASDTLTSDVFDKYDDMLDKQKTDPCFSAVSTIRDKITHHYQFSDWDKHLDMFSDDYQFSSYLHRYHGNSCYSFVEELSHLALISKEGDAPVTREKILQWMFGTSSILNALHQEMLTKIILHFLPGKNLTRKTKYVRDSLIYDDETRHELLILHDGHGRF